MKNDRETEVSRLRSDSQLAGNKLLRLIFAKISSLTLSIIILLIFIIGVGSAAGYIYDATHRIPDPVVRGDDVGGGFVVFFSLAFGFNAYLVMYFPLNKFVYSITKKIWSVK